MTSIFRHSRKQLAKVAKNSLSKTIPLTADLKINTCFDKIRFTLTNISYNYRGLPKKHIAQFKSAIDNAINSKYIKTKLNKPFYYTTSAGDNIFIKVFNKNADALSISISCDLNFNRLIKNILVANNAYDLVKEQQYYLQSNSGATNQNDNFLHPECITADYDYYFELFEKLEQLKKDMLDEFISFISCINNFLGKNFYSISQNLFRYKMTYSELCWDIYSADCRKDYNFLREGFFRVLKYIEEKHSVPSICGWNSKLLQYILYHKAKDLLRLEIKLRKEKIIMKFVEFNRYDFCQKLNAYARFEEHFPVFQKIQEIASRLEVKEETKPIDLLHKFIIRIKNIKSNIHVNQIDRLIDAIKFNNGVLKFEENKTSDYLYKIKNLLINDGFLQKINRNYVIAMRYHNIFK